MAGKHSPQKKGIDLSQRNTTSGKLLGNLKKLQDQVPTGSKTLPKMAASAIVGERPRRFSLIYSSDSSLSDVSDGGERMDIKNKSGKIFKNPSLNKNKKLKDNSMGKVSKLIRNPNEKIDEENNDGNGNGNDDENENENENDEGTESSDYDVFVSSDSDSDVDDDDDDDDIDSDSSSEDENIDFVKLTAQRKKKALQALSAIKRGSTNLLQNSSQNNDTDDIKNVIDHKDNSGININTNANNINININNNNNNNSHDHSNIDDDDDDNLHNTSVKDDSSDIDTSESESESESESIEEDIGEEVQEEKEIEIPKSKATNGIDELHVPTFSDSEESDYNIDQEAYFNAINDDDQNDIDEIDTGIETGEDDIPLLQEEEQIIMEELENDSDLSFDGSIHAEGSDPDDERNVTRKSNRDNDEEDDEYDDEFDMPFYEDPKFASLYYYEDGNAPRLGLSTSLPLLLNDEKILKFRKKQAKKMERKEHIKRRRLLKSSKVAIKNGSKTPALDNGEEYIFGVFFQSDEEDSHSGSNGKLKGETPSGSISFKKNLSLESPLRHLESTSSVKNGYLSSDDENKNILLDEAHIPSDDDDESTNANDGKKTKSSSTFSDDSDSSSEGFSIELDDDDDDISLTNVFIDIDDLDPDSFYFQNDEDEEEDDDDVYKYYHNGSSSDSDILSDSTDMDTDNKIKQETEIVEYIDDESTDEDDNLPPPTSRSKSMSTKAKEVVGANVVGLRPPKLGTWETNSKPFSIIDGLSTKSLYPLIQEHQQLMQERANSQSPELDSHDDVVTPNGDELTLNELLNMSELDDNEDEDDHENGISPKVPNIEQPVATSNWYDKPRVPLSAFRNKGVNSELEDEYLIPVHSTKKFPIGYIGGERTRRKIDRMKEFQRKENEKRRKIKKKKKLLKLKREQERKEKEQSLIGNELEGTKLEDPISLVGTQDDATKTTIKSVGLDEINEILGKDNSSILEINSHLDDLNGDDIDIDIDMDIDGKDILDSKDIDILTSLTAPVPLEDLGTTGTSFWRRRQSIVEAAEENMRFTKNGLFSESALADIEGILEDGQSSTNAFELNEVLQ
ncbi:hypothetical protein Kpol_529p6 [Vanderwaltozyma polyspora DSM 70294]|uniref:Protein IFH1 n=1 Tax=Vanderwaltozyma polyspora (strain ATCC 22028 / DSM 70294 / BCRC 21397 / CBS 2163 / NBRC 10782 / NRRL Y-8283 / UCD 57-17) TaxID=436907 RepID=A7TM59_VANPO|nr:uncharacterized protein Kpol_529p6 [Vanderwaltozyma polyspora DSM 70294]EDO16626.1 hypothetical protein Kpol_529p6 [Vanderwaltozyma polyspora DSM 70294]